MNTPNLDWAFDYLYDAVYDHELREDRTDHETKVTAAKAELAQLRAAAPQKVEGVLVPGWYWVKNPRYARSGSPWSVHYITEDECLRLNNPTLADCMDKRRCDLIGPLTPPAEPTTGEQS